MESPGGTNYNLRTREKVREKRTLSQSFRSSASESPPPQSQPRTRSNSRPSSASKKTIQQIKGRPAIRDLPIEDAFSTAGKFAVPLTGNITHGFEPPTRPNTTVNDDDVSSQQMDASAATTKDADITLFKSANNISFDSMMVNASSSVAATSTGMSKESTINNSDSIPSSSNQGSATFLEVGSFYGSSANNRHRSASGISLSPRMGTRAVIQPRSPIKPLLQSSLQPSVSLVTSALNSRNNAFSKTSKTTKYEQNMNPAVIPRITTSCSLFGPDESPSSKSKADYSDDDVNDPVTKPILSSHERRLVGGGDGPDLQRQQTPPPLPPPAPLQLEDESRETTNKRLAVVIFVVIGLVGVWLSYKRSFHVKVPSVPLNPTRLGRGMDEPESPEEPFDSELMEKAMEKLRESISNEIDGIKDELVTTTNSHARRVEDLSNNVILIASQVSGFEITLKEIQQTQKRYDSELKFAQIEMGKVDSATKSVTEDVRKITMAFSDVNEIVKEIKEEGEKMESTLKSSILRQNKEIQALKSLIRVSNVPPAINESEIFAKMEQVQRQTRSAITAEHADFVNEMNEKMDRFENRAILQTEHLIHSLLSEKTEKTENFIHSLVSEKIAALLPRPDKNVYVKKAEVERMIEAAILETSRDHRDDSNSLVDYALESQGGSVLDHLCSQTYLSSPSSITFFGLFPIWYRVNSPRTVIGAENNPGQCWPMAGSRGHVLIKLSHAIVLGGFSLEHLPKKSSPTNNITSAPRDFDVEVFRDFSSVLTQEAIKWGPFRYNDDSTEANQYFKIESNDRNVVSYVKLNIISNYGHPEYTCLYRFRVHGTYSEF